MSSASKIIACGTIAYGISVSKSVVSVQSESLRHGMTTLWNHPMRNMHTLWMDQALGIVPVVLYFSHPMIMYYHRGLATASNTLKLLYSRGPHYIWWTSLGCALWCKAPTSPSMVWMLR